MLSEYILLNGKYYSANENVLSCQNRGFCYGDALFETIHCLGTQPQFFELHWARLIKGMGILKMIPGDDFGLVNIKKCIEKLLNKNRIFKGARIRLTLFRDAEGYYTPGKDTISWLVETSVLQQEQYTLNTKGLIIDIFDGLHKPVNILSNLKTTNALLYILAGIYRREKGFDECLILNQYGRIAESISSNVFAAYGNTIITPPLSEGCIEGTMRQTILKIAKDMGYKTEERGLLEKNLLEAEEVFLTNAIKGIQWIGAYKERRYYNFIARKLSAKLNEVAF
jgi:branched-subunit amino acid aminotransferase/4-amino-4-deoxychorismate lyase